MKQALLTTLAALTILGGGAIGPAQARHHHHMRRQAAPPERIDQSPVWTQPYVLPYATDPARANYLRRMNLEDGVFVKATRNISPASVTSRNLFILDVTQSLEGGFDSVNIYDKGIASWGIMQWSAHMGSLAGALWYVKQRLIETKHPRIWTKLFTANGLDACPGGLIVYGKPIRNAQDARLAFRGTMKVGKFDPALVTHWATVLARAGRQPEIAALQVEYASKMVDGVMERRLTGLPYHAPGRAGLTVSDLACNDPYAEALAFVLWTNNPRHSFEYISAAARAARAVSHSDDPTLWQPGAFGSALLQRCHESRFGNWRQRAVMIETRAYLARTSSPEQLTPFERDVQMALATRKVRRTFVLASRHAAPRHGSLAAAPAPPVKVAAARSTRPIPTKPSHAPGNENHESAQTTPGTWMYFKTDAEWLPGNTPAKPANGPFSPFF